MSLFSNAYIHSQLLKPEQLDSHTQLWTIDNLQVYVEYKNIKHLYLRVYHKNARIQLNVPRHVSRREIVDFIYSKRAWLEQQLAKSSLKGTPQSSAQDMSVGSRHYYTGRSYQLYYREQRPSKLDNANQVVVDNMARCIYLKASQSAPEHIKIKHLETWYREQLKANIWHLVARYESLMQVEVKAVGVKKMRTLWGSCNINAQRIWLSFELIKKAPELLEYVVVHEMVHLLEASHNTRFYALMDRYLAGWRDLEQRLSKTDGYVI